MNSIDIKEEITAFRRIVCEERFPTVDFDALFTQCFEQFRQPYRMYGRLSRLAFEMAYGEALFENAELDDLDRGALYDASLHFLHGLWLKVAEQGIGLEVVFPYTYLEMKNDTLYLLRSPSG